ncbi:MAG TPA: hypothetical protein VIH06_14700 [Ilumatobacteraceae bacterium]
MRPDCIGVTRWAELDRGLCAERDDLFAGGMAGDDRRLFGRASMARPDLDVARLLAGTGAPLRIRW